ncbi:uncharacterized protein J4E78_010574 [Alternaria triticimaculans]|uniref:uncharacterized protein n=1 Tax=Alternaria triticimaculans TaxID=297637 RepID=UPI0020C5091F|nr:uncharacterized protein J4E78_010574 [Alternaria triticimaculans]KAI4640551.1 hypothetical protein J4E78_010574 [Alternaria triticimaculans]
MADRYVLAQKLLDGYRVKAMELLMDYLRDEDIRAATERYIGLYPPQPTPEATFEHQNEANLPRAQPRNSSLQHVSARHDFQVAELSILTPPTSTNKVSYAFGPLVADMEEISFLSCDDDDIVDQPVSARRAPGRYNLIGDGVVYGRGLKTGQFEVDKSVPVYTSFGVAKWVTVKTAVELTWRRPGQLQTHLDTFYVVSARLLDSDVVLGFDESVDRQSLSGQSNMYRRVPQAG